MKTTGIIVEYNPFHNGHLHHLRETRALTGADAVVAVMSGNFVQRGLPSIADKYVRAKMAIENGVDLVIELPAAYAVSSAEFFAYGATSILNSLGNIDSICFGSESGEIAVLSKIASVLANEPEEYREVLKKHLCSGESFPKARMNALIEHFARTDSSVMVNDVAASSNNVLGMEYLKSLFRLKSSIKPCTVKRLGSSYNDRMMSGQFSSATSIREHLKKGEPLNEINCCVPENVLNALDSLKKQEYGFPHEDDMVKFIKYKFFSGMQTLSSLPDGSEGLDNRIYKALYDAQSHQQLVSEIKTKRYAFTRISRLLCQYFLGFDQCRYAELVKSPCPYARVLGLNATGAKVLKESKKSSSIELITKVSRVNNELLELDIRASKMYSLLNPSYDADSDFKKTPVVIM